MKITTALAAIVGLIATQSGAATTATLATSMGYGLAGGGNKLVLFSNLSTPSSNTTIDLSGKVAALAYRPVTGELYGYVNGDGNKPDDVVLIDTKTGMLTSTGATFASTAMFGSSDDIGFDFNNQIDAARAVGTDGQNLVFFPSNFTDPARQNTVARFTDVFYAAGDTNEGKTAKIFANAYTNAVDGMKVGATLQYAIDAATDSLVTLQNNDGILRTVGSLGIDVTRKGGFDIISVSEGDNLAVALLKRKGGDAGLFQINLMNGMATYIGDPGRGDFEGFAAQVAPSPVPVPASLPLLGGALIAAGALHRARRRR